MDPILLRARSREFEALGRAAIRRITFALGFAIDCEVSKASCKLTELPARAEIEGGRVTNIFDVSREPGR